jgi:beta-1,4-mannosyltransferase
MFDEDSRLDKTSAHTSRQRVALVSPFTNSTNSYIDLQKSLLRGLDFDVKPLSIKSLASGAWQDLFRSDSVVLFHWLETRVFPRQGAGVKLSLSGFCQFLVYVGLMRLARARTIYFVHNHSVHDGSPWQTAVSRRLISWAADSARIRVVHDPGRCEDFDASYLPHPVYWDAPITRQWRHEHTPSREQPIFGILGAIRPYKGVEEVIRNWPDGYKLVVRGKGEPEYLQRLEQLLERRGAKDVSLEGRFLSASEFDAALDALDVLILPQLPDSMLVSGAFFEGIGRVRAIIARKSTFVAWASENLPGVFEFDSVTQLPEVIERVQRYLATTTAAPVDRTRALFGWETCMAAFRQLLEVRAQ